MKVLVGCEFSGKVRDAFIRRGHDALSCDLEDTDSSGPHYKGDIKDIINQGWDLMIVFPPCTYLCSSGAKWWSQRQEEQRDALAFVNFLLNANICKIALENPIGKISTAIRKPDQIIQPWQFGHGETKATCLWLKNLPLLKSTNIVKERKNKIANMPDSKNRSKKRSVTYNGIAQAMANQWG